MQPVIPPEWPTDPGQAAALQQQLAARVRLDPLPGLPELVCGLAVAPGDLSALAWAAAVLVGRDDSVLEIVTASAPAPSPYRPGELAFAVGPACLAALAKLGRRPDLLLVPGHGIAHPRRCGLASHLAVLLDLPTIGCADRPLVGQTQEPPGQPGSHSPLLGEGEELGVLLRTREGSRALVISPGHRVTCEQAAQLAFALCRGHRWPEALRLARLELRRWRRAHGHE